MREIKFRVWDKILEYMRTDFMVTSQGVIKKYPLLGQPYKSLDLEQVELMQYTGLKDKNGVEIYEGDVVKSWTGLREIVFHSGKFTIKIDENTFESFDWELCKVVGNIYENPELLK